MKFRFRDPDPPEERFKAAEESEKAYQAHLTERKPSLIRSDLWRFFGWDFFHDGIIERIGLAKDFRDLEARIVCPNIEARQADGDFDYLNVGFTCRFQGVVFFQMDSDDEDLSEADLSIQDLQYQYAEADTLTERMKEAQLRWRGSGEDEAEDEKPEFHSLIIMTDQAISISLVFQSLMVEPDEPIAFELMLRSGDFKVPIRGDE